MTTTRQQAAAAFFRARLDFQTDVSDVHAALTTAKNSAAVTSAKNSAALTTAKNSAALTTAENSTALIVIDSRSRAAWDQAHIPGAIHLPTADIASRAATLLDPRLPVVAYCWGPGCNGATRAALALSEAGFDAKEMLGGIEYWIREGFPVRTENGEEVAEPDPLTAPRLVRADAEAACGC
jgi:rhodanese-related sulfurtransferase